MNVRTHATHVADRSMLQSTARLPSRFGTTTWALLLMMGVGGQDALWGQEPVAQPAGTEADPMPITVDELAHRQGTIADKYSELEEKLFKLADLEASSNPRRATLLREAYKQSKDRLTKAQLAKVVSLLGENSLKRAVDGQGVVETDLKALLELLLSENRHDRLTSLEQATKELVKELKRVQRLQQSARGRTEGGANMEELSKIQQQIADRAGKVAQQMEEMEAKDGQNNAENSDGQSKDGENKEGENKEGKDGQNKDGENKDGENKDGENKDGQAKDGQSKDGQQPGDQQGTEGQPKDGDSESQAKEGTSQDGQPQGKTAKGEQSAKGEPKDGATKDARSKDGQPKDQQEQSPDPKSQPQENGDNQDQRPQDGSNPDGSPNESDQSQNQQGQPNPQGQPGNNSDSQPENQNSPPAQEQPSTRKRIQAAEERMREATRKLEEAKREQAVEEQRKAEEEIERAIAELEEILRQLREEEVERMLALLEGRFRKMLEMQLKVYEDTISLAKIVDKRRDDVAIRANKLSVTEQKIVLEADRALTLLLEEASSIAFPETVQQMRGDMQQVADRLGEARVDRITQAIEEDIVRNLEELIEALQQAQKDLEKKKQQPPPQQPPSGEPEDQPLVDQIAELRMIRALQMRINTRTKRYAGLLEDPDDPAGQATEADLQQKLAELGQREERVHKITRDIVLGKNK